MNELDPESSPDVSEDEDELINGPVLTSNSKNQRSEDNKKTQEESAGKKMADLKKKLAKSFGKGMSNSPFERDFSS